MRAIRRFIVVSISLLFTAAPAAALDIAPPLNGSGWDQWAYLDRTILEFDDRDWALFIQNDASEFLLPALDEMDADPDASDLEGLLTQVWEGP
jgi:hypothetical protein